eukprot:2920558-Pyramimonas_sp.AAC.1
MRRSLSFPWDSAPSASNMTSQRRLSRAMGLARLLKRWGAQPRFLTNAAPSSTSCCSPSVLRNT